MARLSWPGPLPVVYESRAVTVSVSVFDRFKDGGCEQLCAGLMLNQRITTLSLSYCELGADSGRLLVDTIPNTCIMYVTTLYDYLMTMQSEIKSSQVKLPLIQES